MLQAGLDLLKCLSMHAAPPAALVDWKQLLLDLCLECKADVVKLKGMTVSSLMLQLTPLWTLGRPYC